MSEASAGQLQYQSPAAQEQDEWTHKFDHNPITYSVIRGTEDLEGDYPERLAINLAMTTWDLEIRPTLKLVKRDQNPDITVEFRHPHEDKFLTDKPSVLAYAYFPKTGREGEIVFNDDYLWTQDGRDVRGEEYTRLTGKPVANPNSVFKTYNLTKVLIHEIGHSLGLYHSVACDTCVMWPYYNNQYHLQDEDIQRIRKKYPIRIFKNWAWYAILKNWLKRRKERL